MKIISLIITYYSTNEERFSFLKQSLESLYQTINYLPVEILVVDNGSRIDDSKYLLELVHNGKINTYIRNNLNLHFGMARNQGLNLCNGDFICIADSDILYGQGWLDKCLTVLDAFPDEKIYATPIYNVAHWLPKFWDPKVLKVGNDTYRLNKRAGSNCFVMRRQDFEEVGDFKVHRVAGTKWTEEAREKGYLAAVTPERMVIDMGFRKGYNHKAVIPIKQILSNREEVYFNQDEFKKNHGSPACFLLEERVDGVD